MDDVKQAVPEQLLPLNPLGLEHTFRSCKKTTEWFRQGRFMCRPWIKPTIIPISGRSVCIDWHVHGPTLKRTKETRGISRNYILSLVKGEYRLFEYDSLTMDNGFERPVDYCVTAAGMFMTILGPFTTVDHSKIGSKSNGRARRPYSRAHKATFAIPFEIRCKLLRTKGE